MNSKYTGNITELTVMTSFAKLGYNILIPYGDCERYDFVVDCKGRFIRIQCKTSSGAKDGSSFNFSGRSSNRSGGKIIHHQYTKNEIDYFATSFGEKCYLVPVEECGSTKRLRLFSTKNAQLQGVSWAKDYELEKVVSLW